MLRCGGGGGIRTPDLYSAIVALSQLSYAPAMQACSASIPSGRNSRQSHLLGRQMSVVLSRRAFVAGGLGLAGAIIGSNAQRAKRLRSDLVRSRLLAAPREPLYVAMLDEPCRPGSLRWSLKSSQTLGRRLSIESLGAEQLYANFTIDLLQQTGRYDAVSMNDAWIPYFGRRGYLTAVQDVERPETGPTYPPVIRESARGVDGTELVAYPWTFDFTCSAVSEALGLRGWSARVDNDLPGVDQGRCSIRYGPAAAVGGFGDIPRHPDELWRRVGPAPHA